MVYYTCVWHSLQSRLLLTALRQQLAAAEPAPEASGSNFKKIVQAEHCLLVSPNTGESLKEPSSKPPCPLLPIIPTPSMNLNQCHL